MPVLPALSHLRLSLPARMCLSWLQPLGPDASWAPGSRVETLVPDRWATPYYLVKYANALHRLVGAQKVPVAALEAILTQLLQ